MLGFALLISYFHPAGRSRKCILACILPAVCVLRARNVCETLFLAESPCLFYDGRETCSILGSGWWRFGVFAEESIFYSYQNKHELFIELLTFAAERLTEDSLKQRAEIDLGIEFRMRQITRARPFFPLGTQKQMPRHYVSATGTFTNIFKCINKGNRRNASAKPLFSIVSRVITNKVRLDVQKQTKSARVDHCMMCYCTVIHLRKMCGERIFSRKYRCDSIFGCGLKRWPFLE